MTIKRICKLSQAQGVTIEDCNKCTKRNNCKTREIHETLKEMLETGSNCIEANGDCNICKAKDKCKIREFHTGTNKTEH